MTQHKDEIPQKIAYEYNLFPYEESKYERTEIAPDEHMFNFANAKHASSCLIVFDDS